MEVVLPDGGLLRIRPVPRRSTGPSLKDLFLGGEGTLGVVTRATVSVHPLPRATSKQSFAFPSVDVALDNQPQASIPLLVKHVPPPQPA
jgi:alkyldihydroxyacetonephosphate synthase